jgi:hypothetical protein
VKPFITAVQRKMDIIIEHSDTVVNLFDADGLDSIKQSSSPFSIDIFCHSYTTHYTSSTFNILCKL